MKKLFVTLFAVLGFATAFAPATLANNGVARNGDPGNGDNCTALVQGQGQQFQHGKSRACERT